MHVAATSDQRNLKRHPIQLLVFNQETGKPIGSTIDLHTMGMLIVGKEPLSLEEDIPVLLEFNSLSGEKVQLPLTARGVWTAQNVIPEIHNTGCCFVNTSPSQVNQLKEILQELH